MEQYAVNVDYDLHKEVLERYESLHLKPYGGFLNPTIVPVKDKDGNIVDYQIRNADDFLKQQLEYGASYAAL